MRRPTLTSRAARLAAPWAACLLALVAPANAAAYSDQQALADLNAWRGQLSLPGLTAVHAGMSWACAQHNAYMAVNGMTHDEDPGRRGYTAAGAQAGPSSVLAQSSVAAAPPRALWEPAVYHRLALLDPRLRTTWFAASNGFACMGVHPANYYDADADTTTTVETQDDSPAARTPWLVPYPSPGNGVQGVPTSFRTGESPDPRQAIPGNPQVPGWLLSVSFNGPWQEGRAAHVTSASLTPDGGAAVAVSPQDSTSLNANLLEGAVALFPLAPLKPSTWYTARVAGTKDGWGQDPTTYDQSVTTYPFDVTWRFRTGATNDDPVDRGTNRTPKVALALTGRLHRGRLALKLRAGKGATGRRATIRLYIRKRSCRHHKCRTRWRAVGRRHALALKRKTTSRAYKVSRRWRAVRVTATVGSYKTKAGARWKGTTAKRTVARR
jgi:hypothetical protein